MGIIYSVTPVNETIMNQEVFDWLASYGVNFPDELIPGRYPTFGEIKAILDSLQNYTIKLHGTNADIYTENDHTEFFFRQSNTNEIDDVGFSRGGDIVRQIMQQFANICGTFLLTYDGEDPFFVVPDESE